MSSSVQEVEQKKTQTECKESDKRAAKSKRRTGESAKGRLQVKEQGQRLQVLQTWSESVKRLWKEKECSQIHSN